MAPLTDVSKPQDDPFDLIQGNWPSENESAYHSSEMAADSAALAASEQAQDALDAETKMAGEKGQTAESVASGYSSAIAQLLEHARNFSTISGWMLDASGKVRTTKTGISNLVRSGTSEIRAALDSELRGIPASPSSNELIDKYRSDITQVATTLSHDLDAIGHSLAGTPGSSRAPSYVSVPVSSSEQHRDHQGAEQVAAYNHGDQPQVTPTKLPEMPRATPAVTTESASAPTAPAVATPHSVNPTLSNLIGGGQGALTGTPSTGSPGGTSAPHASAQGSPGSPSSPAIRAPPAAEIHWTTAHPEHPAARPPEHSPGHHHNGGQRGDGTPTPHDSERHEHTECSREHGHHPWRARHVSHDTHGTRAQSNRRRRTQHSRCHATHNTRRAGDTSRPVSCPSADHHTEPDS